MNKTKLSLIAVAILACLTGCPGADDTGNTQDPSSDGGTSSPTPSPTPTPAPTCSYSGSSSGFYAAQNGVYLPSLTIGSTVSSITMYFSGTTIGNHTLQVEAYECGFTGTLRGTTTASITNMQTGSTHKPATFTFSSPITVANCGGGTGTVAFKFSVVSGATSNSGLGFATQYAAGTNCAIKVATDASSATPAQQSTWMATGSYTE